MPKEIKFYKKKKYYILLASALLLGGLIYYGVTKEEIPVYKTVTAKKTDLVQEVSVTGKVEAAKTVNLAFQVGGEVENVFAQVNDDVEKGDKLVSLKNDDLQAQLLQAQASVSSAQASLQQYQAAVKAAQAKLDELKKGIRQEELKVYETAVLNARKDVTDAETTLTNTKSKAVVDLNKVYQEALNALPTSVNTAKTALLTLTDIQYSYFTGYDSNETKIANAKAAAVYTLLGTQNAGRYSAQPLSTLNGGLYSEVQSLVLDATNDKTDKALTDVKSALQKVKLALDAVPITVDLTTTAKTNLESAKSSINSEITTLSNKQQAISVQKATSQSNISTAESGLTSAKNALETAQKNLLLKRAGYSAEQIKAQEALVDQAKANLNSQRAAVNSAYASVKYYQAQIEKTIIRAPMDGVITKMEAKPGEIVLPSSTTFEVQIPLVSIISGDDFEIEANIPEVDISKVKVSDEAEVTLDAYGNDDIFEAVVAAVDPAETVVEGIPTYKTTLLFKKKDPRVKSGMTANIEILTAKKEDVIVIPQRAIITKDGKDIVRILKTQSDAKDSKKTIEVLTEVEVKTGLKGSSGDIEIVSGVEDGDKVVTSIENNE